MNENNEKKAGTRTSSIARRINRSFVFRQFFSYLSMDVYLSVMTVVSWCICMEINHFGDFVWNRGFRSWQWNKADDVIFYMVEDGNGSTVRSDLPVDHRYRADPFPSARYVIWSKKSKRAAASVK